MKRGFKCLVPGGATRLRGATAPWRKRFRDFRALASILLGIGMQVGGETGPGESYGGRVQGWTRAEVSRSAAIVCFSR